MYCSSVWSLYSETNKIKIEKIQHKSVVYLAHTLHMMDNSLMDDNRTEIENEAKIAG